LKVTIFAWRLLRSRISIKDNFLTRGVISVNDLMCVSGCGNIDNSDHLFQGYKFFGKIWSLVTRWLGIQSVNQTFLFDHLLQFGWLDDFSTSILDRCDI
jgi:hypothetical protein